MAFPVIQTTASSSNGTSTSPFIVLPTGIQPGDLLIAIHRAAGAGAITWPAGWTEVFEDTADGSDDVTSWAWRQADGNEPSSIQPTQGNVKSCSIAYRISGAINPNDQPPQSGTVATGSSLSPDPGATTPTGGAKDYLWIAACAMEGETTFSTYPTNYTLGQENDTTGTAGATATNCRIAAAARQLNSSSEDPGTFAFTGTGDDWTAFTIAVHPRPPDPISEPTFDYPPLWIPKRTIFIPV